MPAQPASTAAPSPRSPLALGAFLALGGPFLASCGGGEGEPVAPVSTVTKLAALPVSPPAPAAPAEEVSRSKEPEAAAAPVHGSTPGDILGRPLVIAGQTVPPAAIKRQLCVGPAGMAEVELAKLQVFMDEEIKRRRDSGAPPEEFMVSEQELEDFMKQTREELKEEYPEGDVTLEDLLAGLANSGRDRIVMTKLFQKLYLPDDPEKLPPITREALSKDGDGALIDHLKQVHEERMKADPPRGKRAEDRLFEQIITNQVTSYLQETADVVDDLDKLPLDVVQRVNGVDIKVDDIWKRIEGGLSPIDVRSAKQWITNMTLLENALEEAGAWITDEEADALYHVYSDPYKDSMFSIEKLAVAIKRFPSVRAYKDYRHVYESYQKLVADQLTPENLEKQAQFRTSKLVGQVAVDVDVLLISAFDFKTQKWKENGWRDAEQRMQEVVRVLTEEKRPWAEVLEQYSEFYEPPVPVSEKNQGNVGLHYDKGRFRNKQRNNLLSDLEESEYWLFLNGNSITDSIFYEQEPGTLADAPMKGPRGYYLPMLLRRSEPMTRIPLQPEQLKALTLEDYLMWHLNLFAQELIKKHEVYGLDDA